MAKGKDKEGFGEAGGEEVISPLSYQLNGNGTPADICGLLPEYEGKPSSSKAPPSPIGAGQDKVGGQ